MNARSITALIFAGILLIETILYLFGAEMFNIGVGEHSIIRQSQIGVFEEK